MKKRPLGRTGLEVSEISLGGAFLSSWGGRPAEESVAAVGRALELGVNYIDTAPTYADSEEVLGLALEKVSAPCYISTKLGGRPQPFNPKDKALLRQSVEMSLKALRREVIDILIIHEPDRPGQYDWWTDSDRYQGPVVELLADLKQEGVIRFTGLGGTTAYELPRIMATGFFDVALTAFNYSLLWREARIAVIPEAKRQNMGIVIGSPMQQGALSQRYDEQVRGGAPWMSPPRRAQYQALYAYLEYINIPLPELCLRFVLSDPDISTVLMGARSVAEVEENLRAAEKGPLPQEVLNRLQEIADMVPFRPCEEPFFLPFTRDYRGPGPAR